ncbi:MAG TPA: hypothetical protein VGJ02_07370 [Pyrinomonadaceae bacterium]
MKSFLLLLLCGAAAVSQSPTFYGDRSKSAFYPSTCPGYDSVAPSDWVTFTDRDAAERQGFTLSPCPAPASPAKKPLARPVSSVRTVSTRPVSLSRVVAMTSAPEEWLGKFVTVEGNINITDRWRFDDKTDAFVINDSSGSFFLYMAKGTAKPLRELILKQPKGNVLHGRFSFLLDRQRYLVSNTVYGRMVTYNIKTP